MNHLIVFDIDGTLIDVQGAGRRAMESAFESTFGIKDAFSGISFAGETDSGVLAKAVERHRIALTAEILEGFKPLFAARLQHELERDPGHALPGLPDLLFELQVEGYDLALATGNFKPTAYLKLATFGMAGFFPVGGFGDDGSTRPLVLQQALDRARSHYQKAWDRVTVIGDTPGDMEAAHKFNVLGLGVATGPFPQAELMAAGARAVLPNLSDRNRLLDQLKA